MIFVIASHAYTGSIRDNAVAERVAQQTFNSMYLVMSQGWNSSQLQKFLDQMEQDNRKSDLKVTLYRGAVVDQLFGPIDRPALEPPVVQAIATGTPVNEMSDEGNRYLYPLKARDACLNCHTNATEGQSLGLIEVRQNLALAMGHPTPNLANIIINKQDTDKQKHQPELLT